MFNIRSTVLYISVKCGAHLRGSCKAAHTHLFFLHFGVSDKSTIFKFIGASVDIALEQGSLTGGPVSESGPRRHPMWTRTYS